MTLTGACWVWHARPGEPGAGEGDGRGGRWCAPRRRYNVQFYNQVSSTYSTFPELFTTSNGWANDTAVTQLMAKGVAADKIVVGKPVGPGDAANTGYVPTAALAAMIQKGVATCKWDAGVMGWQYSSDAQGAWSKAMAKALAPA